MTGMLSKSCWPRVADCSNSVVLITGAREDERDEAAAEKER